MDFCTQIAEWTWPIILGMMKTHRNFRMFQKQAKQTSLQSRSPFEIALSLLRAKAGHAFRLTKKGGFRISPSKIHIFGYTDPFFCYNPV